MPWRLLGTVTNTNLPEPGGMTAPVVATTHNWEQGTWLPSWEIGVQQVAMCPSSSSS